MLAARANLLGYFLQSGAAPHRRPEMSGHDSTQGRHYWNYAWEHPWTSMATAQTRLRN